MKNVFCWNIINEKQFVSQGIQIVNFCKDIKLQLVLYFTLVITIAYLDFYMNCCYHGAKTQLGTTPNEHMCFQNLYY